MVNNRGKETFKVIILKFVNTSIRGLRQPFFRSEVVNDFKVNCTVADLFF